MYISIILRTVFMYFFIILVYRIMGKNSSKKGWLEGLKLGLMVCLLLFLFNILGLQNSIKLSAFLFYSILTITSIVGSMIGISFGEKK